MTVQEVRDKLPDVIVVPSFGVLVLCRTTGRNERFATVTAVDPAWGGASWQFSWEAIARAATKHSPLYT